MPIRTGEDYIQSLREKDMEVYYKGERIEDVTTHPATKGMIETQAELYDLQHSEEYQDVLTHVNDEGERESIFYKKPKSVEDIKARRKASKVWMDYTCGMSGRANDFLASGVTGMAIGYEHYNTEERDFGENVLDYYDYCRKNDVSLTHALIDPQIDRSKSSSYRLADDNADRPGAVRKVDENDDGIIVSGARMLATLGPQAEEILIYPFGKYGEDEEEQALAFAVPTDADGLRQICRPSLDPQDKRNHPVSSRLDEMDTFVVLDRVFVPWERVFVDGDVEVANNWRGRHDTAYANLAYYQTVVKDLSKSEFAFAVGSMLAESTGIDEYFHVQSKLGEMANVVETVRSALVASETGAYEFEAGDETYVVPDTIPLFNIASTFPDMYPRMIEIMRDLGGSGLIGVPSFEDLEAENPLGGDVKTYFRGKDIEAHERLSVQKLAYELAISGLGAREQLYERFYTGGPMRVKANFYHNYPNKDEIQERAIEFGFHGSNELKTGESEREGPEGEVPAEDD